MILSPSLIHSCLIDFFLHKLCLDARNFWIAVKSLPSCRNESGKADNANNFMQDECERAIRKKRLREVFERPSDVLALYFWSEIFANYFWYFRVQTHVIIWWLVDLRNRNWKWISNCFSPKFLAKVLTSQRRWEKSSWFFSADGEEGSVEKKIASSRN